MSRWFDAAATVELLDRQFEYLRGLEGTIKLVRLGRVLEFIASEPLLIPILGEMKSELAAEVARFEANEEKLRARLLPLSGGAQLFDARPADAAAADVDTLEARQRETRDAIVHLLKEEEARTPSLRGKTLRRLRRFLELQRHWVRSWRTRTRGHPWPALRRLARASQLLTPAPPRTGTGREAWSAYASARAFASVLLAADGYPFDLPDLDDVKETYEQVAADAGLVHEELRFRLGIQRSRLTIVERYAARCEAFDAARLREVAAANSANAERELTLDLARYLFDGGLNPIIDPLVGGLKPDLFAPGASAFYVEAKQYDEPHPRSRLRNAYRQVWSTWARLRRQHALPEAFLVIFRRSGPWVEPPPTLRHDGLRLFTVVCDISEQGGSREKENPISLSADELLPMKEDP